MDYSWVEDIKEFSAIACEWDTALIGSGNYNPFLLSDFIITWWKHFNNGLKLRIFIIYNSGEIVGGMPLFMRKNGCSDSFARILHYLGGPAANYTEPFYATEETKILPLLEDALAKRNDWDVLYLTDVRAGNRLIGEYRSNVVKSHFMLYLSQDHMNWAIDLSLGKENYFAGLSKKLMGDLRRKRKHLINNHGELKLKEIKGKEGVERYFDFYAEFSVRAFSARNRRSILENKRYIAFLREFLVLMDQNQRLDTHALVARDKVMAVSFGYRFGKGFNCVLTSFNYEYKHFRPGYLLIEELVKEICNQGETYYNWYGHAQFYKSQFCNMQTPLYRFLMVKRTVRGYTYILFKTARKKYREFTFFKRRP